MAFQLWQTILHEDAPALFSVPTRRCAAAWESYLLSALAYVVRDMRGWSCASDPQDGGSRVPARDYLQGSGPYPTKQVDPNDAKHPKTIAIRGDGHKSALLDHLQVLFDWTRGRDTSIPNESPRFPDAAVDFAKSAPGRALQNLRERQTGALAGVLAAYVDDSRVRPGAGAMTKVARWPALADKSEGLWDTWDQARRRLLSGDQWKQIELADVPGGPTDPFRDQLTANDRAFYQALVDRGLKAGGAVRPIGVTARRPPPPPPLGGYLGDTAADLTPAPGPSPWRVLGVVGSAAALAGTGYWLRRRAQARKEVLP